ncbi:MAG: hypothetical protein AAF587_08940 [Bacteroidota bacterium]
MPRFLKIVALVFFLVLMLYVFYGMITNATLCANPGLASIFLIGTAAVSFTLGGGGK